MLRLSCIQPRAVKPHTVRQHIRKVIIARQSCVSLHILATQDARSSVRTAHAFSGARLLSITPATTAPKSAADVFNDLAVGLQHILSEVARADTSLTVRSEKLSSLQTLVAEKSIELSALIPAYSPHHPIASALSLLKEIIESYRLQLAREYVSDKSVDTTRLRARCARAHSIVNSTSIVPDTYVNSLRVDGIVAAVNACLRDDEVARSLSLSTALNVASTAWKTARPTLRQKAHNIITQALAGKFYKRIVQNPDAQTRLLHIMDITMDGEPCTEKYKTWIQRLTAQQPKGSADVSEGTVMLSDNSTSLTPNEAAVLLDTVSAEIHAATAPELIDHLLKDVFWLVNSLPKDNVNTNTFVAQCQACVLAIQHRRRESRSLWLALNDSLARLADVVPTAHDAVLTQLSYNVIREAWVQSCTEWSQYVFATRNASAAADAMRHMIHAAHNLNKIKQSISGTKDSRAVDILKEADVVVALRLLVQSFSGLMSNVHHMLLRTPKSPHNPRPHLTVPTEDVVLRGGVRLTDVLRKHDRKSSVQLLEATPKRQLAATSSSSATTSSADNKASSTSDVVEREQVDSFLWVIEELASIPQPTVSNLTAVYDDAIRVAIQSGSTYAVTTLLQELAKAEVRISTRGLAYLQSARERARALDAAQAVRGTVGGGNTISAGKAEPTAHEESAHSTEAEDATPDSEATAARASGEHHNKLPKLALTNDQWDALLAGAQALVAQQLIIAPSIRQPVPVWKSNPGNALQDMQRIWSEAARVGVPVLELGCAKLTVGDIKAAESFAGSIAAQANAMCQSGSIRKAVALFDHTRTLLKHFTLSAEDEQRCQAIIMGSIIRGACNSGKALDAKEFFSSQTSLHKLLPPAVFSTLIEALANTGSLDDANSVVNVCQHSNITLPFYTYLSLVNATAEHTDGSEALLLLRRIQRSGQLTSIDDNAYRGIYNLAGLRSAAISAVLADGLTALRWAVTHHSIPSPSSIRIYHSPALRMHVRSVLQALNPPIECKIWGAGHKHRHLLVDSETLANFLTAPDDTADVGRARQGLKSSRAGFGGDVGESPDATPAADTLREAYFRHSAAPRLSTRVVEHASEPRSEKLSAPTHSDPFQSWHAAWQGARKTAAKPAFKKEILS